MSRHHSSGSYGHEVIYIAPDTYRISWIVDFYYPNSRLRWPRTFSRLTDEKGVNKFAKKWFRLESP